jgi:heme/copper-type cytochrome/quinol oxidase subunit 3
MKTHNFPFIASGLGLFLMLLVLNGSQAREDGATAIPLLTLLIVSEFAFFVTAIGGYLGIRHILANGIKPAYGLATLVCALLAILFLWMGIMLWPS